MYIIWHQHFLEHAHLHNEMFSSIFSLNSLDTLYTLIYILQAHVFVSLYIYLQIKYHMCNQVYSSLVWLNIFTQNVNQSLSWKSSYVCLSLEMEKYERKKNSIYVNVLIFICINFRGFFYSLLTYGANTQSIRLLLNWMWELTWACTQLKIK